MRCCVTGAAGFIGSHLSMKLVREGHSVIGIDCFTDYYARELKEMNVRELRRFQKFTFLEADLLSIDLCELFRGMDIIFHLAAQAGVRASWGTSFQIYTKLNILATQRVLESALKSGKPRIVYASSSSVYGDAVDFPTKESATPQPVSPYGVSKLAAEHLCRLYTKTYGLPTVSLRYFTVYGPRQRPDMAFHKFGKAILTGDIPEVYGDGLQTRDFTFVSDAVEATFNAGFAEGIDGCVMNIGGGSRISLNHALDILYNLGGKPIQQRLVDAQKGDVKHTAADISLAAERLNYQPRVSIEEGLQREMEWLKQLYDKKGDD